MKNYGLSIRRICCSINIQNINNYKRFLKMFNEILENMEEGSSRIYNHKKNLPDKGRRQRKSME